MTVHLYEQLAGDAFRARCGRGWLEVDDADEEMTFDPWFVDCPGCLEAMGPEAPPASTVGQDVGLVGVDLERRPGEVVHLFAAGSRGLELSEVRTACGARWADAVDAGGLCAWQREFASCPACLHETRPLAAGCGDPPRRPWGALAWDVVLALLALAVLAGVGVLLGWLALPPGAGGAR